MNSVMNNQKKKFDILSFIFSFILFGTITAIGVWILVLKLMRAHLDLLTISLIFIIPIFVIGIIAGYKAATK